MSQTVSCAKQADPGKGLAARVEGTLDGSAEAPASPRSIARSGSGIRGSLQVEEETRRRVRERIALGLAKNPSLAEGQQDLDTIAAACEEKCFHSCSTRFAEQRQSHHESPSPS